VAIETLGDAEKAGWRVRFACAWGKREGLKSIRECQYGAELDLPTLVATRGRDFPLSLLADRLRCPRCRSRRVRVIYEPPAGRGQGALVVG
jgi:hypothetical protein